MRCCLDSPPPQRQPFLSPVPFSTPCPGCQGFRPLRRGSQNGGEATAKVFFFESLSFSVSLDRRCLYQLNSSCKPAGTQSQTGWAGAGRGETALTTSVLNNHATLADTTISRSCCFTSSEVVQLDSSCNDGYKMQYLCLLVRLDFNF